MNSPSSSDTIVQPWRMWRLSESDLYWVAMKTWRRPELMQLLRTKSMMRYGPAEIHRGLGPFLRQRRQTLAHAARQHDYQHIIAKHRSLSTVARWPCARVLSLSANVITRVVPLNDITGGSTLAVNL